MNLRLIAPKRRNVGNAWTNERGRQLRRPLDCVYAFLCTASIRRPNKPFIYFSAASTAMSSILLPPLTTSSSLMLSSRASRTDLPLELIIVVLLFAREGHPLNPWPKEYPGCLPLGCAEHHTHVTLQIRPLRFSNQATLVVETGQYHGPGAGPLCQPRARKGPL